jgi:hypothetical protein
VYLLEGLNAGRRDAGCMLIGNIDVANLPESRKARESPMQLSKRSGYGYQRAAGL